VPLAGFATLYLVLYYCQVLVAHCTTAGRSEVKAGSRAPWRGPGKLRTKVPGRFA